jgi:peptidoglycan/xylan/chitin deacetylase (PgdA/CDA1 family)
MKDSSSYVVLLFHSVDARKRLSLKDLGNIGPEIFREACVALKREFDIVDLRKLVDLISMGDGKRGRFLSVTFDDGPKSYALSAAPILESLGVPSTCFLITDCVGDKAIYWRYLYNYCINAGFGKELAALVNAEYGVSIKEEDIISFTRSNFDKKKTKLVMEGISRHIISEEEYLKKENELFLSHEDIRRLKESPYVEFGIHTRTHPVMKGLGDEEISDEISGSVAFYHNRVGSGRPMFSVPFGRLFRDYDERTVLSALDLSIEVILSAYGGRNEKGQSLYNIRRIPVHEGSLESGVEKFVRSLCQGEIGTQYRKAEKKLNNAVGRRDRLNFLKGKDWEP